MNLGLWDEHAWNKYAKRKTFTCLNCERRFIYLNGGKRKFCSVACRVVYRRLHPYKRNK